MTLNPENRDKNFKKESDEQLWKELKTGSRAAFIYIYNSHVEDLIRYGCQVVNDKYLVEDVIHDVFVNLWEKREALTDVHSIKYYLLSTIRRILMRRIKMENRFVSSQSQTNQLFEIIPSYLDEKLKVLDEKELHNKIHSIINALSERQREIIYLKFYQSFSYQQIADLLGLDQKYTYNLAARAFASFKEKFESLGLILMMMSFFF